MKRLSAFLLAALGLWACNGGSTASPPASQASGPSFATPAGKKEGPVVAKYGQVELTAGELQAKLNEKSPYERARYTTLERKKEFVENLARFELLAEEAQKRGLDKDPEVLRAAQTVMVRKLIQAEIDENPAKKNISDTELQAYYQAHLDDFVRPEMVRLSAIFLAAPDAAAQSKRMPEAKKLLEELKAKASDFSAFGQAARLKSEDPATKAVDGDLRFSSKEQLTQRYGPQLADAAFGLGAIGQLSEVVKTDKGLYLLKVTGKTPALNQTFEQVKNQVQSRMWYEKRSKLYDGFVDELKKKGSYTVVDGELEKVQVQTAAPTVMNGGAVPSGALPLPGLPQAPGQHAAQALPAPIPASAKQPVPPATK